MSIQRIRIVRDSYHESPREWDNLGTMVCWHPEYLLGDKHEHESPEAFEEWVDAIEDKKNLKVLVKIPLYLYDHSGISMSTNRVYPYNCPWDSMQVGWIYVHAHQLISEYGSCGVEAQQKATQVLENEVRTYNQYLTDDVWGFVVEEKHRCSTCKNETWETLDSCWGFYGSNPETNGMKEHIEVKYHYLLKSALREEADG